ncbi:MAG TPA: sigma-70 family RNA polymerase sigma factor [Gemmatimonadaceae bacterium]|nr:sigma-70 family RNA polymerase sigma factor [Gemmatimonadaceae bacterium]
MTSSALDLRVERLLRDLAPHVLGAVVRRFHDFAASEDAVQEALIAASAQWPRYGVPDNPRGWLIKVALRRMSDYTRSEIARRNREAVVADEITDVVGPETTDGTEIDPDDTLVLLFMCCHPALTPASAIALTLRAVGGLTTAEIAKSFLVPESTIGQRISRAKQSIRTSSIPFRMPDAGERAQRLSSVLHVLYLVFNEGYTASEGAELHRTDLSNEAIRLTREAHKLLPDDGEVAGLLALMLLTDARRAARTGVNGELITLDEQDRRLWDSQAIAEGVALISAALSKGSVGEYQLQAAIAAVHDEAARVDDTDWPQILALYSVLMRITDNPVVALNHAIAKAMVDGPNAGLALLAPLQDDDRLRGNHRLDAVRAHLLERAGERDAAVKLYREAASKTTSLPERDYLLKKAARASG